MSSSKEVFALRKSGSLDEAYAMALQVIKNDPTDEWNTKALAWCLYDLTKRATSKNDYSSAKEYVDQLQVLRISQFDEILIKSIEHARMLASPEKRIILQAKDKSKQGQHQEALSLFRQAIEQFPNDVDLNTQFGWELYKEGKIIFDSEKIDINKAKNLLAEYIKLKNERPSQLHTLFLWFADKLIDREEFNLISFLKLWDLNNLRDEDFVPFTKEGRTYPSIAEKIIQHGSKLILGKKFNQEIEYFLPFLNKAILKCRDNIWLTYYNAKLLHLINENEKAIKFLIPVVKEKISDYWTWSLLAELLLESDYERAISCYCKSLLCTGEDKFIANVRMKFGEILIQRALWSEAKFEFTSAIRAKLTESVKIPDKILAYEQTDWFKNAPDKAHNNDFYNSHKQLAEELIFESLAWLDGTLGETFTVAEKPGKPRRKVFIKLPKGVIEVVISDRKFNTNRNYNAGDSIKIKGEYDQEAKFQIFLLEKRYAQEIWDLFEWYSGNVVQIIKNDKDKNIACRVSAMKDGIILEGIINMHDIHEDLPLSEGCPLLVKLYQKKERNTPVFSFSSGTESRIKILAVRARVDGAIWDSFPDYIGVVDHINDQKKIAHFIVSKEIHSVVKLDLIKVQVQIGSTILVKLKKGEKDKKIYYTVLSCSLTEQNPDQNLLKSFSGIINRIGQVGFVDNVFIDNELMQANYECDVPINGIAILNYNKKRAAWGWKAIKIF